ncbi:flagellar motor protein MotB [Marinicrinis lubricantis]
MLCLMACLCLAAAGCSDNSDASGNHSNDENITSSANENNERLDEAQQEEEVPGSEEDAEQTKNDSETVDFEVETDQIGEAPEDQGALKAWLQGEITVQDNRYLIKGTTNLEPGSELYAEADAKNYAMWGYNDRAEVGMDGRFEMEIKKPDVEGMVDLVVQFKPADQEAALHEIYGEKGERLQGPYVYQYVENDEMYKLIQGFAHLDIAAEAGTIVPIEEPNWEKPEDYGASAVWMTPEVTLEGEQYIVTGQSNLLEGAEVKAKIEIPDHWSFGYSDDTSVNPDGSFRLSIKKPDVDGVDHIFIILQFKPEEDMWPTVKQAYGLKGEKLTGDLVKPEQDGEEMIQIIELKVKVNVQ